MNEQAFKELIDQYITGRLSHENQSTFAMLLEKPEYQAMLEAELERSFMNDEFEGTETAERKARLNTLIFEKIAVRPQAPVHRVHFLRRSWVRITAAAAILLLIGSVAYYSWLKPVKKEVVASLGPAANILPGGNKATLTLGDGSVIVLDSAANGALAQQGSSQITKAKNGELIYEETAQISGAPHVTHHSPLAYNTLATPRGGQYQLVLPDGSKVWLNAVSSIRYPASFTGTERRVEITGEAYFEVTHNKKVPFVVTTNGTNVTVLGTHFNVNTYAYENAQRVTLLEGSVRVSQSGSGPASKREQSTIGNKNSVILKPGQQAALTADSRFTIHETDVEQAVAWKNGKFSFGETADIKSVMNQVADWYNVNVVYKGATNRHISGTISRNVNLGLLLQMLKATGVANFNVEGKTVEVIMN
ncbi:MAG TPA: FecR domain-containing protein [Niastella sp.]